MDRNEVIRGTDCSKYRILKTSVPGLKHAFLAARSAYLLDHPVG